METETGIDKIALTLTRGQWLLLPTRPLFYQEHIFDFGTAFCVTTETHLVALYLHDGSRTTPELLDQVRKQFSPTRLDEKEVYVEGMPLLLIGTPFQLTVWQALLHVPVGQTTSYQSVAEASGNPRAIRAVGTAIGANPIGYFVPCHRVLRSDGSIGGFYWGVEKKKALLATEHVHLL
jgi:AraC family transcriptional regulator of adaptative response/methylated-DNA-[protein]-cysteine methyltransferase